jgi:hypothetical protein
MAINRNAILDALVARLSTVMRPGLPPEFSTPIPVTRELKVFAPEEFPVAHVYLQSQAATPGPRTTWSLGVVVELATRSEGLRGAAMTEFLDLLDAIEKRLEAEPLEPRSHEGGIATTLDGLVAYARIEGDFTIEENDEGTAVWAAVPITILIPA